MESLFIVRISLLKWKWDKLIMSELLFQKLFINNHGISIDIDKGQEFHGYWCLYTGRKLWEREDMFPLIQFSSVAQLCLTLCNPIECSTSGLPVHHQLPEFTQTHVHPVGDAIQPSHPLSSPSPPALKLSQHQGLFHWVSSLHQVAKVLGLQLQHQSFQYSGLISFRMDCLDLLAVQGTLKSLLQHHSSKASIGVQLSL